MRLYKDIIMLEGKNTSKLKIFKSYKRSKEDLKKYNILFSISSQIKYYKY